MNKTQRVKQKVFLTVLFRGDSARVIDVHATRKGAERRKKRLEEQRTHTLDGIANTFHIVEKSVQGTSHLFKSIVTIHNEEGN